jgi:hypothetical protein
VIEAQHALTAMELELQQTQELEQEFEAEVAQSHLEAKLTQVCIADLFSFPKCPQKKRRKKVSHPDF